MSGRGEVIERHRLWLRKMLERIKGPIDHGSFHLDIELACFGFMIRANQSGPRKEYKLDHYCRVQAYRDFEETRREAIKALKKEKEKGWGGPLDISLS